MSGPQSSCAGGCPSSDLIDMMDHHHLNSSSTLQMTPHILYLIALNQLGIPITVVSNADSDSTHL